MRTQLLHGLLPRGHRGPGLVYLVYGDELLGQERLDAMKIISLVSQFGVTAIEGRLRGGNICLGFVDRSRGAIDVRGRAISICPGSTYGAHLRGDRPSLIDNLALQRGEVRPRFFQGVFVGPWIDLKEQLPLFAEFIVLHGQLVDRAVYLRSYADKVGKHLGIVCARVKVRVDDDRCPRNNRGGNDDNADDQAEPTALFNCVVFRHRISSGIN